MEFIQNREPDEILSAEEYEDITKELLADRLANHDGPLFTVEEYDKQVLDEEGNISTVVMKRKRHSETALQAYRETIIERRQKTFKNNEREVRKRWAFESAVSVHLYCSYGCMIVLDQTSLFSRKATRSRAAQELA